MISLSSAEPYKSIPPFGAVVLPDLSVITGLNGSGKSQLFIGIEEGRIVVEGIEPQQISYISSANFIINDASEQTTASLSALKDQYWNHFIQNIQQRFDPARGGRAHFTPAETLRIHDISTTASKNINQLTAEDFGTEHDLYAKYDAYQNELRATIYTGQQSPQCRFFQLLYEDEGVFFGDINRSFLNAFLAKDNVVATALPAQISATIFNYASFYYQNKFANYLNQTENQSNEVLNNTQFTNKYGPKPWELIDETLKSLGATSLQLDFNISSFNPMSDSFRLAFVKRSGRRVVARDIPVTDLSSGEKTLLALICSMYNRRISKDFPKLLLLDEVDSSLHPSMVSGFIKLVSDNLVDEGNIKVALISHSPTTIALTPEDSIHVMGAGRRGPLILKESKSNALNLLTDGFVAITESASNTELKFSVNESPTDLVYGEGITDQAYLKEAARRACLDIFTRHNLLYAQGAGGLDSIWKLLKHLPPGSGLTHGKKVTLYYDGDQKRKQEQYDGHRILCMDFVSSNPIKTGIENLFPQALVDRIRAADSMWVYTLPDGNTALDEAKKSEVAKWVIANASNVEFADLIAAANKLSRELTSA